MKLVYWSDRFNFGDAFNPWFFPAMMPRVFESNEPGYFYGVGTMLFSPHYFGDIDPKKDRCIVFGSGYRLGANHVELDPADLDIRFVRGPLSAASMGIGSEAVIADSAYALLWHPLYPSLRSTPKKYNVTFIPHISTVRRGFWRVLKWLSGVHVLLPDDPRGVEFMLREIAASELVVAEAMHGAIFADILRIPWVKCEKLSQGGDSEALNQYKWNDWLATIDRLHVGAIRSFQGGSNHRPFVVRAMEGVPRTLGLARTLRQRNVWSTLSTLSDDATILSIKERMGVEMRRLGATLA